MNQFFILSIRGWHKYSTTVLLLLVWKHLRSLHFLDYFIHWLVCIGLHVMDKIFRDADKAKGPVYELPGPQAQCKGYSTRFYNLLFVVIIYYLRKSCFLTRNDVLLFENKPRKLVFSGSCV